MRWWFDMGIRSRMVLGFLLPLVALVAFNAWLWSEMGGMRIQAEQLQQVQIRHAMVARDLEADVIQVQQFLSDVSATRGRDGLDDGFKEAAKHRDEFLQGLHALADPREPMAAKASRDLIEASFERYYQQGVTMAHAYVDGGPEAGNALMPAFDAASEALQKGLEPFVAEQVTQLNSATAATVNRLGVVRESSAAIGLTLVLVQLGIALLLARQITRPLHQAVNLARAVAAGDLSHRLTSDRRDETGQLISMLDQMVSNLREMITRVRDGAGMVAGASNEIAQGNSDLSSRTEQQAASLQQTASSMTQFSQTVHTHADRAQAARDLAMHASQSATDGGQAVGQMVATMGEIQTASKRIADIISVIDGIAFQTNILALNAAVEAARAGEQGRGFAVVASEVRSLAQRSSGAAREIRDLIGASVLTIDAGNQLASRTGSTIEDVVAQVRKVAQMIGEMSESNAQENADIDRINRVIADMDQSTQQNAALVEQMAAAAISLRQQAGALDGAVSAFRLETV